MSCLMSKNWEKIVQSERYQLSLCQGQWAAWWAKIEQKLCKVKIFQLQSTLNVSIKGLCSRILKNSRISCLAFIFKLKNPTVLYCKKLVAGGEIRRVIYHFFKQLIRTNGLVVKAGRRDSGNLGLSPNECWNSAAPGPFCMEALSQSVPWHTRFLYCCTLYNCFFLNFVSGESTGDLAASSAYRVVNLNTTIWLALWWRTWTWARAHTRHMCRPGTWAEINTDYHSIAIVEPRSWPTARSVALFFPDFSKIYKKRGPSKRLF